MPAVFPEGVTIRGGLSVDSFDPPTGSLTDRHVNSAAAVAETKLRHRHQQVNAQARGAASVADRRVLHVALGAGTLDSFRAGVSVACVGGATVTVDLYKNGTTVLSAPISITSAIAAYAKVAGTVSSAAYVAGDVFETVVTVAAGGGTIGQGAFTQGVFSEDAA